MKSFNQIHSDRKGFVNENCKKDHVVLSGKNNVIISAPHGVSQVRLGKYKHKEIGSLASAIYLSSQTNSFLIAKTKNNFDDANFDENSSYKKDLLKCVKENKIKYVIDLHGLAERRNIDINFGTHLDQNIVTNKKAFENLSNEFIRNGFNVSIDQPFMGGVNTISGFIQKNTNDVFSLQIEINCAITNKKENYYKYCTILNILKEWINNLE